MMRSQEQRVDTPTRANLEAWLKQLQEDQKDQVQVVNRATAELERAKRDAEQIQRSINAMITALKDAGIG